MKDKELVSVIVPVYNVQDYIVNCCESIIHQTYKNLEIILINDGSTDASAEICRKYAGRDRRIRLIDHQVNEGPGKARNAGIRAAAGNYIVFVDSDDFVALNYIEQMYLLFLRTGCDITVCRGKAVYDRKRIGRMEESVFSHYELMDSGKAIKNVCYQRKITPGPCAKMFRKGLFDNISFPATGYEDLAVIYRLLHNAAAIAFVPEEKYYYVQRSNNTTLGKFDGKKLDRILVAEEMKAFLEKYYPELHGAACTRCFLANIQTLNVLPFRLLGSGYAAELKKNMKAYRGIVLKDPEAKGSTKIMAAASCLGMPGLKILGKLYNGARGHYKVRLSRREHV